MTGVWSCLSPSPPSVGRSRFRRRCRCRRLRFRSLRPPLVLSRCTRIHTRIRSRSAGSSAKGCWADATADRSSRLRREPTGRSNVRSACDWRAGECERCLGGRGSLTSQCLHGGLVVGTEELRLNGFHHSLESAAGTCEEEIIRNLHFELFYSFPKGKKKRKKQP